MTDNDRPELERCNSRRIGYLNMIKEKEAKKRSRSKRTRGDKGE